MTMMPNDGDDRDREEGATLPSEETSAAEAEQDAATAEADGDEREQYRRLVQDVSAEVLQAVRPLLDNNYRGTQAQVDRLSAQIARVMQAHGAGQSEIADMRELVERIAFSDDDDARKAYRDQRELARLRKLAEAPPSPPPAPQQRPSDREPTQADFDTEVGLDLAAYARKAGFSDEDMQDSTWNGRMLAAGAPHDIEWTAAGRAAYKRAMREAIDRLAAERRKAARPRTVTPNPTTAGGGRRDYSAVSVRDLPNEEFQKNFQDIALAVINRNRRG